MAGPALAKGRRAALQVADDFLDNYHEQEGVTLAQARQLGREELVGRKLVPLDGKHPGYAAEHSNWPGAFTLRCCREGEGGGPVRRVSTTRPLPAFLGSIRGILDPSETMRAHATVTVALILRCR